MNIPKQLQQKDFRFVLIRPKDKAPFEMQWQKIRNYPYDHKRLELHKGNLGIIAGYGNLVILDIDDLKLINEFDKKCNTFSVKTGSGGRHFYFLCEESFQKSYYVLGDKQGELRCTNSQVVCPGSTHPNGNKYEVFNDIPILNISKKDIRILLGKLLEKTHQVDVSRSGIEWGEVLTMVENGYNYDDVDREMRLLDFTKWKEAGMEYRLYTYCGAVRSWKLNS